MGYTLTECLNGEFPIELPDGWKETFQQMCELLDRTLRAHDATSDDITFLQVKEKFGQMRVYTDYSEHIGSDLASVCEDFIEAACSKTAKICCNCGNRADYDSTGWICPFCENCAKQIAQERHISFENNFKKISH